MTWSPLERLKPLIPPVRTSPIDATTPGMWTGISNDSFAPPSAPASIVIGSLL